MIYSKYKISFVAVSAIYVISGAVFNFPIFSALFDNVPIAGLLLAPIMAIIESMLAGIIGHSIAHKNKGLLFTSGILAGLLLLFLFIGQSIAAVHSMLIWLFLLLLFSLSVLFSYTYHKFEKEHGNAFMANAIMAQISKLEAKSSGLDLKLENEKSSLKKKVFSEIDARIEGLKSQINSARAKKQVLEIQRQNTIAFYETVESRTIEAIKSVFTDYNAI